jgi:hypothetical protein
MVVLAWLRSIRWRGSGVEEGDLLLNPPCGGQLHTQLLTQQVTEHLALDFDAEQLAGKHAPGDASGGTPAARGPAATSAISARSVASSTPMSGRSRAST